jgi:hypothetical protein
MKCGDEGPFFLIRTARRPEKGAHNKGSFVANVPSSSYCATPKNRSKLKQFSKVFSSVKAAIRGIAENRHFGLESAIRCDPYE